ncbi:hypothetical protein GCM10027515_31390 [Schumannella luteola]|uniref:Uncharacterized protein n=1 Tax=Schumannella luteola TaxID=472059 RepID=A0A852YCK6_9MICO|nr:hypothetical protein [Schumannella luteola]NYG99060.1 hypothetical protein [Schumannella luteola]
MTRFLAQLRRADLQNSPEAMLVPLALGIVVIVATALAHVIGG